MDISVIGVIGAGQMGQGIAQVAAQAGVKVHLIDVDEATAENGVERIAKRLGRLVEKGKIDADTLTAISDELGLDDEAFSKCVDERRYADFVEADFTAGQQAGVTGTPAFFVNGIPLKGARDADSLSRVVDSELERIRAN